MIRGRMLTNHLNGRRAWRPRGRFGMNFTAQQHYDRMYWSEHDHYSGVSWVRDGDKIRAFDYRAA